MKVFLNIVCSLIIAGGIYLGFDTLMMANGVPQQLSALIPVIFAYVLAKAIEFMFQKNDDVMQKSTEKTNKLLQKLIDKE